MMIINTIANELAVKPAQVEAAVKLLDEGSTVPFIARYRKEKTGGLDDTQLRTLEERLRYLTELEERRASVLESIREQEKLIPLGHLGKPMHIAGLCGFLVSEEGGFVSGQMIACNGATQT